MAINRRDLIVRSGATAAALTAGGAAAPAAAQTPIIAKWHHTADVVVIGGGATGIPAAIAAREAGSSVILVEAQPHVGGHARVSAAATCRSAAAPACRRNTASRTCPISCSRT